MGTRRRSQKHNNNKNPQSSNSKGSGALSQRGLEPTGRKPLSFYDDDDEEEEEVVEVDLDLALPPSNRSRRNDYDYGGSAMVTTGNICPNNPSHPKTTAATTTTMMSGKKEIPPTGINGLVVGDNINASTAAALAAGALEEGCLHCQRYTTDIQVRCDECQSYICQECHWCHEFQANHEIRVCDRCDAFYCRNCDEMDQCDDCGEVVCASCSTLLSCKFCGGGLCEECATACGRCGIVLCSRDAKFAVDCDTCRLSYCLVCLASGSKDPCVRCGHRPSKRMEQLVHLRLKSIYKAFKQSTSNTTTSKSPNHHNTLGKSNRHHTMGPTIEELEDGMDPDDFLNYGSGEREDLQGEVQQQYMQKQKQQVLEERRKEADAAAEALLAELEEEEEAAKTKKSKKKRKKARQQKAKQKEEEEQQQQQQQAKKTAEPQEKESQEAGDRKPETLATRKKGSHPAPDSHPHPAEASKPDVPNNNKDKSTKAIDANANKAEASSPSSWPNETATETTPASETPSEPKMDPIEKRLFECVEVNDIDGIEGILFELKGVPGKAALRKNAKKALKRLRTPATQESTGVETSTNAPIPTPTATSSSCGPTTPQEATADVSLELIRMVSDTNVVGKQPNRAECVMQMSPVVVGWVIGKGGQRIRDLMEESGAKVWIDQEKAKPEEVRSVYISGDRKSVDQAVRMIRETVSKAPIDGAQKYAPPVPSTSSPTPAQNPQEAVDRSLGPKAKASSAHEQKGRTSNHVTIPLAPPAASAAPIATPTTVVPGSTIPADAIEHILTCEARFVPLLIGKRGWAIKDIQDKSGARVDIDQTVTPRQIRISGSKVSVEKAIPMVLDVLNYPHAQPQPGGEIPAPPAGQQHLGVAAALHHHDALPEESFSASRPHSPPPPSSYVMTGDSKSMISASSSLSSTPEPSMASSNSRILPLPATARPLIPPIDYATSQLQGPTPGHGTYLPQDMPGNLGLGHAGFLHRQNAPNPAMYGNGLMNLQHIPAMSMMPTNPAQEQLYSQGPNPNPMSMGHSGLHASPPPAGFGTNNIVSPNSRKAVHAGPAGLAYGMMGAPHQGSSLPTMGPQQSMNPGAAPPIASLGQFGGMPSHGGGTYLPAASDHNDTRFQQLASNAINSGATSLWEQKSSMPAYTPPNDLPAGAGLSDLRGKLCMDSPNSGPGKSSNQATSFETFGLGTSIGGNMGDGKTAFVPGLDASPRPDMLDSLRDDAKIIDSLFGPMGMTSSGGGIGMGMNAGSNLISGFNGLSIGGGTAAGAVVGNEGDGGLWATSFADLTSNEGESLNKAEKSNSKTDSSKSALLAGFEPFHLTQDTQQHPSQSRFNWDMSTNA